MASDVADLTCLFAICILLQVKCLSSTHFPIGFVFVMLSFETHLCILDTNPLLVRWLAHIPS